MLAMSPSLLEKLETPHLCAALEAEGALTPAERELTQRLRKLSDQESPASIEQRLEKQYESALEQSEFRAQLIRAIIEMCALPGTKAELVKSIKAELENSYVEL